MFRWKTFPCGAQLSHECVPFVCSTDIQSNLCGFAQKSGPDIPDVRVPGRRGPIFQQPFSLVGKWAQNLGRDSMSCCRKSGEELSSSVEICRKTFPEEFFRNEKIGDFLKGGVTEGGGFHSAVRGTMFVRNGAVSPGPSRECDITFFVKGRPKSAQQSRDSTVAACRAQSVTVPSSRVSRECRSPGLRSPPLKNARKNQPKEGGLGQMSLWTSGQRLRSGPVHTIFAHNSVSLNPPLPKQGSDGFPLEFLFKGPQTELRTLPPPKKYKKKLQTNRSNTNKR